MGTYYDGAAGSSGGGRRNRNRSGTRNSPSTNRTRPGNGSPDNVTDNPESGKAKAAGKRAIKQAHLGRTIDTSYSLGSKGKKGKTKGVSKTHLNLSTIRGSLRKSGASKAKIKKVATGIRSDYRKARGVRDSSNSGGTSGGGSGNTGRGYGGPSSGRTRKGTPRTSGRGQGYGSRNISRGYGGRRAY